MRRVTINLALNSRRGVAREARARRAWWERHEPAEQPQALDPELLDALHTLSPQQRAAVALHYLEDRWTSDIADLLGCSESTARVHLHRGRQALAHHLGATPMSDHDTIPSPETDDELRARLRAFARAGQAEQADTEAALERMPRRSRPPTIRLLADRGVLRPRRQPSRPPGMAHRQSVDTVPPETRRPPNARRTTQPRVITQGAQMKNRFAAPVASAATALMLLGACSDDDGPTDAREGRGRGLRRERRTRRPNHGHQRGRGERRGVRRGLGSTLTGWSRSLQCQDTDTEGLLILGGEVTTPGLDGDEPVGSWISVIIREGDPDAAAVWFAEEDPASCQRSPRRSDRGRPKRRDPVRRRRGRRRHRDRLTRQLALEAWRTGINSRVPYLPICVRGASGGPTEADPPDRQGVSSVVAGVRHYFVGNEPCLQLLDATAKASRLSKADDALPELARKFLASRQSRIGLP